MEKEEGQSLTCNVTRSSGDLSHCHPTAFAWACAVGQGVPRTGLRLVGSDQNAILCR